VLLSQCANSPTADAMTGAIKSAVLRTVWAPSTERETKKFAPQLHVSYLRQLQTNVSA
jgi:hypothetical protein